MLCPRVHSNISFINKRLSAFLHCVRWIAAMLVMTGHLRDILFVNYKQILNLNVAANVFYFVTGFGHYAVIIFFVMSGFLIGGETIDRYISGSFDWRSYLIKRTSRIYVVFIPVLLLGGMLDISGLHFFNTLGIYDNTDSFQFNSELTDRDISANLTKKIFIGNLAMLQTVKVPVLGSNGPLWSLANEFWYYLLFPSLLGIFFSDNNRTKINCAILSIFIYWLLPFKILMYFFIWILGALTRKLYFALNPIFSMLQFILLVGTLRIIAKDAYIWDVLISSSFCITILAFNSNQQTVNRSLRSGFHKIMADFSYTLYALHFPLILFIVNALSSIVGLNIARQPHLQSYTIFFGLMAAVYAISYYLGKYTEGNTGKLRRILFQIIESDLK